MRTKSRKLHLGDAMRTTMTSSTECFTSSYVYEIFSDDEIHYLYDLMRYVHKFYQFIGSQDRTKDSFTPQNTFFLSIDEVHFR